MTILPIFLWMENCGIEKFVFFPKILCWPIREPGFVTNLLFVHFRIGLMPSSGWPMQNKLDGIFVCFCRFLIHAVLFSFLFCLIVIVCV